MGCCVPKPVSTRSPTPPRALTEPSPTITRSLIRTLTSVQLYQDPNPPECPYCGQQGGEISDMMVVNSHSIPYDIFELLMERGWWRTGNVIFKPQTEAVCCPCYAIRMKPHEYQLTKNHRRILNKWKEFLLHGDPCWEDRHSRNAMGGAGSTPPKTLDKGDNGGAPPTATPTQERPKKVVKPGLGPDPNRPLCRKSKEKKAEKFREKQKSFPEAATPSKDERVKKSLLEVLQEHEAELDVATPKHKLEIKLVSVNEHYEMRNSLPQFFTLYNKFQDSVHPGQSKFDTADHLHWGFITTPLIPNGILGTYHMRYYLDGELIMISVLDILPHYLVSIYFIYDPDIRFLQPGIYTCLREMELILKLQAAYPELVYYNLGFFSESCPKISYKKQFKPTEILCPVTNTYVPLSKVIPMLKETKYCRFADDDMPDTADEGELNVDSVIVFDVTSMSWQYYKDLPETVKPGFKSLLQHYMKGAGHDILTKMLISR